MRARAGALALALGLLLCAGEAAAQTAVCSDTPGAGQRIACEGASGSAQDVTIDAMNPSISTSAANAYGVYGRHRGTGGIDIDLTGAGIATAGRLAYGVYGRHEGTGAIDIDIVGGSITTAGRVAEGVWGHHLGGSGDVAISANGAEITTEGNHARAIFGSQGGMSAGAVSIDVRDSSLVTKGHDSYGVYSLISNAASEADVAITLSGGSVKTAGIVSKAVYVQYLGARGRVSINLNDVAIATKGDYAHGVFVHHVTAGGIDMDVSGGSITTAGEGSYGVWANQTGTGGIDMDLAGVTVETTGARAYGVFAYQTGAGGDIAVDMRDVSVKTAGDGVHGVWGHIRRAASEADVSVGAGGGSVSAEGLSARGFYGIHEGLGSVSLTTGAETSIVSPFFIGAEGRLTSDANAAGRLLVTNGGAVEAREVGVLAWAARSSGSTFGEGTQTADDASRTAPMIHVISSGDVTVGAGVTDTFIRAKVAGEDGTLSAAEQSVLSAVEAGDSDALDTALDALPADYDDAWKAEARNLLRKRGWAPTDASPLAHEAAGEILEIPRAGIRALALSHAEIADHVREGDRDPAILAIDEASRTTQQKATLAAQALLSAAERTVLEAALTGGDLDTALAALPTVYTDAWKDEVRRRAASYNAGDVRVDVTGGSITSGGDGVHARYVLEHDGNGAIMVNVSKGAEIAGERAGVFVSGAGLGRLGRDEPAGRALGLTADEKNLRRQFVAVHGVVRGGSDAAVHLSGGGTLLVGGTGEVLAGASGRAVLVNDPGRAIIVIRGTVRGGAGAPAAVHLTGGGTVTIGLTGSVEANGAEMAIRGDAPTKIVVQASGGLTQEVARAAVARVGGGIGGEGGEISLVVSETRDGFATGHLQPVPLDAGGAPALDELLVSRFDCGMATDRRCELYEALPSLLLALNRLPAYAERMAAPRGSNGVWGRVEAAQGEWTADAADSVAGSERLAYDYDVAGGRAGFDFEGAGARFGLSAHFLKGKAEMDAVGEMAVSGMGAGASATWLWGGFHLDFSGQATWFDAEFDSSVSGKLEKDASGKGFALGVEIGRRASFMEGALAVTPRLGLVWSNADLGDFTDSVGSAARVSVEKAWSARARAGFTLETGAGEGGRLFASADLEQEFSDETSVEVGDAGLDTESASTTLRLGVGGALPLGGSAALTLSGHYEASGSGTKEYGAAVSLSAQF